MSRMAYNSCKLVIIFLLYTVNLLLFLLVDLFLLRFLFLHLWFLLFSWFFFWLFSIVSFNGLFFNVSESVGVQVEIVRERMLSWKFFIDESIQIEDDTLKVNQQDFGHLTNDCFLRDIYLLLTKIASIIINLLTCDEPIEGLGQVFSIFYF